MFCIYCGAPNPDSAAFCSKCGKAVAAPAVPVQTQSQAPAESARTIEPTRAISAPAVPASAVPAPPQRRSHILRNLGLVAVLVAGVIVIAIALAGPNPQTSLERAGTALINQDAAAFDNYVDVKSILGDWTDQAASGWLSSNSNSANALVTNGLVAGFKSLLLPKLAASVEQGILTRGISDQSQSGDSNNASNYLTGFLSDGIRTLFTSQLKYQGVASQTKSGTDAFLDVRFSSSPDSKPFIVRIKMQRAGDHWRIVAIPDAARLLAQLHPPPNTSLQSAQTDVPHPADVSGTPPEVATPSPIPLPSTPPAAKSKTDEPDDDPLGNGGFITPPTR